MATMKNNPLASRLQAKKQSKEQPAILQEEEKRWSKTQIIIFVVMIYAGMTFMNGCFTIIDLKAQQNDIVSQTQEAETQQKAYKNDVSYMQTNEAVEKTAREDLNMVKPGEILLTQRDKNASTDDSTADDAQDTGAETTQTTGENTALAE